MNSIYLILLALADVLLLSSMLIRQVYDSSQRSWPFSDTICKGFHWADLFSQEGRFTTVLQLSHYRVIHW